jgi:hypothetical protein
MPKGIVEIIFYLIRWFSALGPVYVLYKIPEWGISLISIFGVMTGLISNIMMVTAILYFKGKMNLKKIGILSVAVLLAQIILTKLLYPIIGKTTQVAFAIGEGIEPVTGIGGTQIRHLKLNGSGNPIPFTLTRNLTLFIDDSVNSWKLGQTLRIVCDSQIIPSTYTITVKTDSQNITNSLSSYNTIIAQLNAADFPTTYGRTGTTIIDIICTNAKTLTFSVDKIIR